MNNNSVIRFFFIITKVIKLKIPDLKEKDIPVI